MNLNKLKGLRVENGLTQKELAEKLGFSETTYVLKEKGRVPFKDYEIAELCKIFNVSASIFFENNVAKN